MKIDSFMSLIVTELKQEKRRRIKEEITFVNADLFECSCHLSDY